MYIDPVTCIDCAACEPACPVSAIFVEGEVPAKWQHFIRKNAEFFKE
ncbi:MAG TPA: 4Fe-4S binding protein [Blastocatellia bacterium]|nr:4Fe-4S binding protein [Blastocatellia bacterium]